MTDNEDILKPKLSFLRFFLNLKANISEHPWKVAAIIATVVAYVTLGRSLPLILAQAIDRGFKNKELSIVVKLAVLYFCIDSLRSLASYLQNAQILRLGNKVLYEIRERLTLHVQQLPMNFFDKNASGRIVTRLTTDINHLGELFTDGLTGFFVSSIDIVSIVIAMSIISWRLTGLVLGFLPLLFIAVSIISNRIRERFATSKKKLASLNASASESLAGLNVVYLFAQKAWRRHQFVHFSREYRDLQIDTVGLFAALWPIVESFNIGIIVATLFFGRLFYQPLHITIGELAAFVLLVQSFFHPLRVILERYNMLQNSLASADRVFDMLQQPIEDVGPRQSQPLRGHIEFRNVSFRYSQNTPFAVQRVSFEINPGESVALIGRTGSGKTTLIALLQKFYDLTEGHILIDGKNLQQYSAYSLRSRFGVILQDPFLFRGTLRDNVTLHRTDIHENKIKQALAAVDLYDLDFFVEERGSNLSAGERQLVAFARLLVFDPDVLILDEATSHIDSISEQKIQRAVAEVTKGRTSLIIAHRLSTITHCDKIIMMKDGELYKCHHQTKSNRLSRYDLETLTS